MIHRSVAIAFIVASATHASAAGPVKLDRFKVNCVTTGYYSCQQPALVFVHGIWGSASTWRKGSASWPQLVADDPAMKAFDIYLINYDTYLSPHPNAKVSATQLEKEIRAVLQPEMDRYQAVYIVAHSLGGNLIRQYLAQVKISHFPDPHEYMRRYKGLFLLATPVTGSDKQKFAKYVLGSETLRSLAPISENDYLQELNETWEGLQFRLTNAGHPIMVWAAFEKRPLFGLSLIVTQESAVAATKSPIAACLEPDDDIRGFDRDHESIVKPTGDKDEVYTWVRGQLLKYIVLNTNLEWSIVDKPKVMEDAIRAAKQGNCDTAIQAAFFTQEHNPRVVDALMLDIGPRQVCSYLCRR